MKNLFCLECPNGCHLTINIHKDNTLHIDGNNCEKGLTFTRRVLKGTDTAYAKRIVSDQVKPSYTKETLTVIVSFWGISLQTLHPHLMIGGSPERTVFRIVIEDDKKNLYVLEQIPPAAYPEKMKIIKTLEFLSQKGLSRILPYISNHESIYIQEYNDGLWQIKPFAHGVPLDREKYLYEGWRANLLSEFLIELRKKAVGISYFDPKESFSVKKYIYNLIGQIKKHHPVLIDEIGEVVNFLEKNFMKIHDQIPVSFCHGDYHPLNIIWGKDCINAVIDWEFLGYKPEIYDMANMIGCLGIEHPSSLLRDLVINFVSQMRASKIISNLSWEYLLEFIIAIRFAWLSEWLHKDDREMIELEGDYLKLLIDKQNDINEAWGTRKALAT